MRVGIVNDLALAREVLRRVVKSVPNYSVAWFAEDGDEAVTKTAFDPPDVILMDLVMPRMDGVEATRRIMARTPCPILVVTASVTANFELVFGALGAGVGVGIDALLNRASPAPRVKSARMVIVPTVWRGLKGLVVNWTW